MSDPDLTKFYFENTQKRLDEVEESTAGLIVLLKHLVAELGDFCHNLGSLTDQMMTRMGFVWEALGGKVEDETTPDSEDSGDKTTEDSSEDSDAEIIPFPTDHDGDGTG